jgi:hypothetical protein
MSRTRVGASSGSADLRHLQKRCTSTAGWRMALYLYFGPCSDPCFSPRVLRPSSPTLCPRQGGGGGGGGRARGAPQSAAGALPRAAGGGGAPPPRPPPGGGGGGGGLAGGATLASAGAVPLPAVSAVAPAPEPRAAPSLRDWRPSAATWRQYDRTFSSTVWRLYIGAKGWSPHHYLSPSPCTSRRARHGGWPPRAQGLKGRLRLAGGKRQHIM